MAHVVNDVYEAVLGVGRNASGAAQLSGTSSLRAPHKKKVFVFVIDIETPHLLAQEIKTPAPVYVDVRDDRLLFGFVGQKGVPWRNDFQKFTFF